MLRNKFVIAIVAVLLCIVSIYNLNFFLKKKAPASLQGKTLGAAPSVGRDRAPGHLMATPFPVLRDKENWKRDPFLYMEQRTGRYTEAEGRAGTPAAREKTKAPAIRLQGITVRNGKRFALVNGWVVGTGDRLDNVLITDITPYSIFVKDADGTREINIYTDIPDKEK
jgi:hypothetical protein